MRKRREKNINENFHYTILKFVADNFKVTLKNLILILYKNNVY